MSAKSISFIGLGRLGLPLAVSLADSGHKIVGVDTDAEKISSLKAGRINLYEPGLNDIFQRSAKRLYFTDEYSNILSDSDITFIVVPTPSSRNGAFSLKHIFDALKKLAPAIKIKKGRHLLVLTSTVMPGAVENEILPYIKKLTGKICPRDIGFCYNPELIALGSAMERIYNRDFVLIGESDKRSGDILESLYKKAFGEKTVIERMNFINAELTKLALNVFLTDKISFANALGEISAASDGADIDVITRALGRDRRIGPGFLKCGMSFGGPCFRRDSLALQYAAEERRCADGGYFRRVADFNNGYFRRLLGVIIKAARPGDTVGILGLSYKEGTDAVDDSPGISMAEALLRKGMKVAVYDPAAMRNAEKLLPEKVIFSKTVKECVDRSDVIAITVPWPEFRKINIKKKAGQRGKTIIDFWRALKITAPRKNTYRYIASGKGHPRRHYEFGK